MSRRPTASARGYGPEWRRESAAFLREFRWCRYCEQAGRQTRATIVDHIRPHRGDQRLFWDRSNWQPLCKTCHDGPKQSEERTGHVRGAREDGTPLDPAHHWNRA